MKYLLKIKDLDIPIDIKEYKTAKTMKMFFRDNTLIITKPKFVSKRDVDIFLMTNEPIIYREYKNILEQNKNKEILWQTGQKFLYKGEDYTVNILYHSKDIISIRIEKKSKTFNIILPNFIKKEEIDENVKIALRRIFKNNTQAIINDRLPYWSQKTGIKYTSVKVQDAKTKFGSCVPKTKALHFSSRLIMLNEDAVDAIIVHELCHIVYPNHGKEFYKLVNSYISNYKEIDKYLKDISKRIREW